MIPLNCSQTNCNKFIIETVWPSLGRGGYFFQLVTNLYNALNCLSDVTVHHTMWMNSIVQKVTTNFNCRMMGTFIRRFGSLLASNPPVIHAKVHIVCTSSRLISCIYVMVRSSSFKGVAMVSVVLPMNISQLQVVTVAVIVYWDILSISWYRCFDYSIKNKDAKNCM